MLSVLTWKYPRGWNPQCRCASPPSGLHEWDPCREYSVRVKQKRPKTWFTLSCISTHLMKLRLTPKTSKILTEQSLFLFTVETSASSQGVFFFFGGHLWKLPIIYSCQNIWKVAIYEGAKKWKNWKWIKKQKNIRAVWEQSTWLNEATGVQVLDFSFAILEVGQNKRQVSGCALMSPLLCGHIWTDADEDDELHLLGI